MKLNYPGSLHGHSEFSNLRLRDCIIRIDDFLSDWVDCTPTDSVIEKIDSKIVCKKIFIIIRKNQKK